MPRHLSVSTLSFLQHYQAKLALDRWTILCHCVPGLRRQVFKHVPKCEWIPVTRLTWIPRTYSCNANFVGIFNLLRIPQQANIAGYLNSAPVSGFRKMEFRNLFITELAYALAEFKSKDLSIVSGIHEEILKPWLTKSLDVSL